ncbi:hypothetical protein OHC33_008116 [Knufia fluminis]|uniref:Uncharacterized protein n=1 Tax=Knufia fluminis TaxID=191047 RepID=A0AAN8EB58_9EURO|nr:hypothetical protein OHC33_008116 [Knufia fluminis]
MTSIKYLTKAQAATSCFPNISRPRFPLVRRPPTSQPQLDYNDKEPGELVDDDHEPPKAGWMPDDDASAVPTDTVRDKRIGVLDTKARNWQTGMILYLPHVVPTLNRYETDPDHAVHTEKIAMSHRRCVQPSW